MKSGPWIRFFPSDWLAGTRGMTAGETGVYITLISLMYERGGEIEHNTGRLARLCGTSNASFVRALKVLKEESKIHELDGFLTNKRVTEELSVALKKSSTARESANYRWHKKPSKNNGSGDANAMQMQCERNAIPEPELEEVVRTTSTRACESEFNESFWPEYPHKVGKGAALKAFEKAIEKTSCGTIIEGIRKYIASKPPDRPWCNPATWLNQERWTDEPAQTEGSDKQARWKETIARTREDLAL